VGLYQCFFIWGLALTSGFSAALLNSTSPLFSALFVFVLGQERLTPAKAVGLLVAYGGVALFVGRARAAESGASRKPPLPPLRGDVGGYTVVASRLPGRLTRSKPSSPRSSGDAPLLLYCAPYMARQDYAAVSAGTWVLCGLSAFFPLVLAFRLWTNAIHVLGVGPTTSFGFLVPILAGVSSALWTGETFDGTRLLAAAIVLAGLALTRAGRGLSPASGSASASSS